MVNAPARRTAPHITVIDGQPTTTSRDIAETFGKRHDDVLKRIRLLDCSPEYHARNFAEMVIEVEIGSGATRKDPAYHITRDGFAFLCMGFTGSKAAQWKERYINTFNQMADKLADHPPEAGKTIAAKPLALPAPRLSAEVMTAIDARAGQIAGSVYTEMRQWLVGRVLSGCINADGNLAPNFASTLASADFAAFSTNYASKHMATVTRLLQFVQEESSYLLDRLEKEKNQREGQP